LGLKTLHVGQVGEEKRTVTVFEAWSTFPGKSASVREATSTP
jgi:hypothetical protein